jgi:hypothetical protein
MTTSSEQPSLFNRADLLPILALMVSSMLIPILLLPSKVFFPDAPYFADILSQNQWVAHPPGYLVFLSLAKGIFALGLSPDRSLQTLSLLGTLLWSPFLYRWMRHLVGRSWALPLSLIFSVSWLPFYLAGSGTPYIFDLASISGTLWFAHRLLQHQSSSPSTPLPRPDLFGFGLCLALTGSFRLTTLIMLGPLLLWLLFILRRNRSFWLALFAVAFWISLLQFLTWHFFGGWGNYQDYAARLHEANLQSSLIGSGLSPASLVNIGRFLLWFTLPFLPLLVWFALFPREFLHLLRHHPLAHLALLTLSGPFLVYLLYICVTPGYLTVCLPPMTLLFGLFIARLLAGGIIRRRRLILGLGLTLLWSGLLFFGLPFFPQPHSPAQAAYNGLLGQYTASASRQAVWKSTSLWLLEAGREKWLPDHRQDPER